MEIELKEQKSQPVLSIRTRTTLADLPNIIGDSYHKIAGYLEELGEQPADVPFTAYYNLNMQDMDIEMGFPVSKPLPGKGDIKAGKIPLGKVASYMYKGIYSEMEPVYNEIFKWINEKGYQPRGVYYEYYYNAPDEVPESELLTRIVIPLE
jgi:effector-binding domain-containing protein